MIRKNAPNNQATQRKVDHLYTCLRYCENQFECRRTLQLQFFGESFDRVGCNKTCDNCRAGNVAENRNLTAVAREFMTLLQCVDVQKNGRGVTLHSLTELWRGTKAKAQTKFLNLDTLTGYGNGSKFSKSEADSIAHALVYEKVLEEVSVANTQGFNSEYVRTGPRAQAVQVGSQQFTVRFPVKKAPEPKAASKKAKKDKADGDKKPRAKKKTKKKAKKGDDSIIDLADSPEGSSVDEEVGAKRAGGRGLLPRKHTDALYAKIKKLVSMWAAEEQINGNNVFCESFVQPCFLHLAIGSHQSRLLVQIGTL